MTPIRRARVLARRCATQLGHRIVRMRPSAYWRREWVGWCLDCGRTLRLEPDPDLRGEWLLTGNAIRMQCATAVRTYRGLK